MMGIPSFPPGLHEANGIAQVSLRRLLDGVPLEMELMCTSCETHGFFHMDLRGCDLGANLLRESEALHDLSHEAFALSREEKEAVAVSKTRCVFGYKAAGITHQLDPYKRKDKSEMWSIAKDDAIGNPAGAPQIPYPPPIQSSLPLIRSFSQHAHTIGMLVLRLLASHLGIPPDMLVDRHRMMGISGDHTRLTRAPGSQTSSAAKDEATTPITTYAHTDFGSFTLLFNWLGGLQIQQGHQEDEGWVWLRPLPDHAICNLGDAMGIFSGGRLRSANHRVIEAPGEQALFDRYSVVYFVRPEDDVILEDLTSQAGIGGTSHAAAEKKLTAKEYVEGKLRTMGNRFEAEK